MSKFPENNATPFDNQPDDSDEIDLGALFGTLLKNKWLILTATAAGILLGLGVAMMQKPLYKSNALLKLQEKSKANAGKSEIEQLKSRQILGQAVTKLHLDIQATPQYYREIGEAIARHYESREDGQGVAEPWFNKPLFAWGGEQIQVESLTVPKNLLDTQLTLVAAEQGHFQLLKGQELILKGEVGKLAQKQLSANLGEVSILVSTLKARPGTQFNVMHLTIDSAIDQILSTLTVAEKGKETGLLELSMESDNPKLAMSTLNSIIDTYLQKNIGTKSTDLEKSSELIDKQLLTLKNKIDASTQELEDYKAKNRSIDVNLETQNIMSSITASKNQISQLQLKHDELRQKFTESHPYVETLNKQIARLNEQLNADNKKLDALPKTQQVIQRLTQEINTNNSLYATLLNSAQTKRVDKEADVEQATVIDYAQLAKTPIKPNKPLILAISTLLGSLFGVILAFIRQAMNKGVEDPSLIEKKLNLRVYASVPHSKNELAIQRRRKDPNTKTSSPLLLALENADDLAIESLRNLRTTLHFTLLESKNKAIMITGPSPGIGKSFISLNLAAVLADTGKKVLLIDADMRKGVMNRSFFLKRDNGLSELLSNQITLDQAVHHISAGNFDFIATGVLPPNPSELLLHKNFSNLLETLNAQYDHIIIDSPPVLAVTDASIIGRMAGLSLMIVKEGRHSMNELEQAVKMLAQAEVNLKGAVFNDYKQNSSAAGFKNSFGYVYQYEYQKNDE